MSEKQSDEKPGAAVQADTMLDGVCYSLPLSAK
jgi:hypothetical protein